MWLSASRRGGLHVDCTHDADNPLLLSAWRLFVCDSCEHAYYLYYQQDIKQFVREVVARLISWRHMQSRFERLNSRAAA